MADLQRVDLPAERLRPHVKAALAGRPSAWPGLEEPEVVNLAAHGVAPLLYALAGVPELRPHAIAAAAGEPLRLRDLRAVTRALAQAGVPVLIMKGSALAHDLYPAPELRPRGDTDLLVPRASFDAARIALRSAGFAESLTSGDDHGVRQATFSRVGEMGATHVYDLHWAAVNSAAAADAIRQESIVPRPLPRVGPEAFTLPQPEALLLACVHRVVHHYDDPRLIWLYDIALLRRAMSRDEHERFWRLAAANAVVAVCRRSVELADAWIGESGPSAGEFLSAGELARPEPTAVFLDPQVRYGDVMLTNLAALSWSERMRRVRQLVFPPREFMRQSFPSAPAPALPLLYAYRLARGVMRMFRRERP